MKIAEDNPPVLTALDRPNSYIGRSVPRPNLARLTQGRAQFVSDVVLPRMAHVAFVRSPHAHARILTIDTDEAKTKPGVIAVASELVAVRPEKHARDDHDLARAAASVLRAEGCCDLEVPVSQAAVTLEGRVDWPYQRARAARAVAEVPGVERVENRIRLVERVSAWDVKRGIEGELQRQAARTARRIRVELADNRVTLTGAVRSTKERDDVERAAWSVSGVLEVRNRLEIRA